MGGGNTDTIYKDGTLEKSKMLARLHPDCIKIKWKYRRWHHDYTSGFRRFKKNKLIKRDDIEIQSGINNYGMKLVRVNDK